MFEVLVPPPSAEPGLFHAPCATVHPVAGVSGSVAPDKVAVFARLDGKVLRCLSGHLWVTFENDPMDHVLKPGQRLFVPSGGKVIVGGRGRYQI